VSEPLDAEIAAAQEEAFLARVTEAMDRDPDVVDPATGRSISLGGATPRAYDDAEEIRRKMASLGVHDAALFERLPRNRCLVWRVRRGLVRRRTVVEVVAAVVNPVRELILGQTILPPATFGSLTGLMQERLSGDGPLRLAGVFSPTGWEGVSRFDAIRRPGLGLWLFRPGLRGGFATMRSRSDKPPPPFDIESRQERIELVVKYVADHRLDLVMKGLAATEAARTLSMTPDDIRAGFAEAAKRDEFLRLDDGDDPYLRRA
jgi:hypothetical protein